MEYRRIKDQDKDGDSVDDDVESLRGKPHSGPPSNLAALVGNPADRTKWKRKSIVTLSLTVLTSSQAILIVWSKGAGKYEYSVTTANFLVETLKCALSVAALARIWRNEGVTDDNRFQGNHFIESKHDDVKSSGCAGLSTTWDEVSVYPIPAALYLIKNLLQYYIFAYVDAPGYQILKNFNIISTGVLYRIILKRKLSEIQWAAFILLCAGCTTAQLNSSSDKVLQTPLQGWVMAIIMALLSGFAGVYTEAIIKKRPSRNINVQNFWLYVFGMIFNAIAIVVQDFDAVMNKGFFHGYSFITVLMILNHALRKQGMRTFCSAPIVKRHDGATLETVDSITIMVHGYLNSSRTLENGFSQEVCDHFQIGFPYYWEDFATLSVSSEEPGYSSASKGVSPSDAYKTPTQYARETNMTPTQEARGTNMMSAIQSMDSADHRTTRARKKRTASSNLAGGGPLTRSRARCRGAGWIWE